MKVLVYGDNGGSGGYFSHFKGLFCGGVWQTASDVETIITGSNTFLNSLSTIDNSIRVISTNYLANRNAFLRYYWHLWVYPHLVKTINPDIEFFPSGNLRDHMRSPKSVTMCRNLLPFDAKELDFYKGEPTYKYWRKFASIQGQRYERSTGVIFLSEYSRDTILKQFPGITHSVIIPHGIDNIFRLKKQRNYKLNRKINILYLSPIYNYKHQGEVLLAIKLLREKHGLDINLRLIGGIGGQKDYSYFKKIFDSNNAETFVKLMPFIDRNQTIKEFRKADIFVFASSCECFPNSLLEAMASRLPIACSNRSGLSSILKDSGLYFDPEYPDQIADALFELISNEKLRLKLGNLAFNYSEQYSWRRCSDETINYLKLIGEKK